MSLHTDLKQLAALALCHQAVGSVVSAIFRGEIPSQGFLFDVNNAYVSPDNAARLFWGLYERNEIRHLHQFLCSDLDVIEFGSGIGAVSLNIAAIQERDRKLVCVEANPYLIETLQKNLARNAPWKKVAILNKALDYSGQSSVKLRICPNNLGSEVKDVQGGQMVFVETTTLKTLLRNYTIGEFALVSDAEGAEAGIILEDAGALSQCRQMVIELHKTAYKGHAYSVADLYEKIERNLGFQLVAHRHDVYVFEKSA